MEKKIEKTTQHPVNAMRKRSVPLVALNTSDPAASLRSALASLNGKADMVSVFGWDMARQLYPLSKIAEKNMGWYDPLTQPLPEMLNQFRLQVEGGNMDGAMLVLFNVPPYFGRDGVIQAIWNLRDSCKAHQAMVLMIQPSMNLPGELSSDVMVIDEPVPSEAEIKETVEKIVSDGKAQGAKIPDDYDVAKPVSGLKGLLSAFDVEQTAYLCLQKDGFNLPQIWERKIARVRGQCGAEITVDNPDFNALAGCSNVKSELTAFINGRRPPKVVLFLDEIEKMFAGAGTDSSGVTGKMTGQFLTWTADRRVRGMLLAGIPGAGKTWTAQCAAGQAICPCFKLNISELQGSLVGQSEQNLKLALKAVDAISSGDILMIASANWVNLLTPDVIARFTLGTFFYDFPDAEELSALWRMYIAKYELPEQPIPASEGWVGREIENACWRAWQFNRPLIEVAKNIVPSAISQKGKLEELRKSVDGRFLNASKPGVFMARAVNAESSAVPGTRKLDF